MVQPSPHALNDIMAMDPDELKSLIQNAAGVLSMFGQWMLMLDEYGLQIPATLMHGQYALQAGLVALVDARIEWLQENGV